MAVADRPAGFTIKHRSAGVSPVSPVVLVLAALISAPATWAALVTHELPLADALARFLVAWVACAFGCALLAAAVGPRQRPRREEPQAEPPGDPGTPTG